MIRSSRSLKWYSTRMMNLAYMAGFFQLQVRALTTDATRIDPSMVFHYDNGSKKRTTYSQLKELVIENWAGSNDNS